MWKILTIIAVISMALSFFRGRNSVWGGAAIGLVVGVIVTMFQKFDWAITYKAIVVGALIGTAADLLGLLSDFLRKK